MADAHEIDYAALIDSLIDDFRPAKRLWPIGVRLTLWLILSGGVLAVGVAATSLAEFARVATHPAMLAALLGGFAVTADAGWLALRSAVPDRPATARELIALGVATIVGFGLSGKAVALSGATGAALTMPGWVTVLQITGLAAGPCAVLLWAVAKGVPIYPRITAALIGAAGCGLALLVWPILTLPIETAHIGQLIIALIVILAAALGVGGWLLVHPAGQWRRQLDRTGELSNVIVLRALIPAAVAFSLAVAIFVPRAGRERIAPIPDFDLAIASYQESMGGFHSNVPSGSVAEVLTAYVEHGMPAYMWDFGPEGFQLVGGRLERMPDGTPVTYTWFHGSRGGVICLFKRTDAFTPPPRPYTETHNLFFYRYRGFSLCLINVGGYGIFISVIAAPMPMREFIPMVLKSAF
jgi:hypothetical protein